MTPKAAHAELDALLTSAGVRVADPGAGDPPYATAFSAGPDLEHLNRGAIEWRWRIVVVAGSWDTRAAADALDDTLVAVIGALHADFDFMLREVTGATVVNLAGGRYLAADVITGRQVTLT